MKDRVMGHGPGEPIRSQRQPYRSGERNAMTLKEEARRILSSENGVAIEYVSIADPETLTEVDSVKERAVYAVAVRIGKTRLIDNALLEEA